MAFDQQQTPVKSTKALVQFPALPAIKATPAEWEQWYFNPCAPLCRTPSTAWPKKSTG